MHATSNWPVLAGALSAKPVDERDMPATGMAVSPNCLEMIPNLLRFLIHVAWRAGLAHSRADHD
jgi:hypothetical protein